MPAIRKKSKVFKTDTIGFVSEFFMKRGMKNGKTF